MMMFLIARKYKKTSKSSVFCSGFFICHQLRYKSKMVARTIIAQYVKEMRKKYKLTQVDLSEKAGVGLRFVRELEQGKTTLRLDKVNKVFELFGSECGPVPMKREGDAI